MTALPQKNLPQLRLLPSKQEQKTSRVVSEPRTRKRILWFVRISEGSVSVYARKPRRGKRGQIIAGKQVHTMCYRGFFRTFGLAIRIGEAIRMPIMSLCERHVLKPRKKRCVLPLMTLDFRAAVKDAYEELIGQFMQGPPVAPAKNEWIGNPITIGARWTISTQTISNDTNVIIDWGINDATTSDIITTVNYITAT